MTATVDRSMTTPPAGSTERLDPWRDFAGEAWREAVDVAGFIRANVRPYAGDSTFLSGPSARTTRLWE